MIFKKKVALILITFLFIFTNAKAIEPDAFIQSTINDAVATLGSEKSREEKISDLKKIASETVDINGIGFYSLGSHRKDLDDAKKKEYILAFNEYFMNSFSNRLVEYTDPVIEVSSKEKLNENYTIVSSKLLANDKRPEIKIEWRVYTKNPNKPLIRDLIIEGLSLARTQKEEFNSIIISADGNIDVLISNLNNFSKDK